MIPALLARYLGPILVGLGLVLALAALCAWLGHTLEAQGKAQEQAAQAQQALRDAATARAREQTIQAAKEESDHEASVFNARAAADRVSAAGAADRLRQRFAAINGAGVPTSPGPVPAGASAPEGSDGALRAHVLSVALDAAQRLAAKCDEYRAAGDNAQRQYEALTP